MKIGLFFGSFNPVHIGHLIIAEYMLEHADLEEVWFVVSPQNPFKMNQDLMPETDRIEMVRMAIEDNRRLSATDIEFGLPKPSYSITTMKEIDKLNPDDEFAIIMGYDNLEGLHKWEGYQSLLAKHKIFAYYREGYTTGLFGDHPQVKLFKAPVLNISATFIRECLVNGRSVRYLVTPEVEKYLYELFAKNPA